MACPEIRSIATVFDYHGQLNDANVLKGVWTDANGQVPTLPEAIFGSMFQTLRLLDDQVDRGVRVAQLLREEVQALWAEQQKVRQELEEAEKAILARERAVAAREQEIQDWKDSQPAAIEFERPDGD